MNRVIRNLYRMVFPSYEEELEKAVGDCRSLLDVGCGNDSPIKRFSKKLYSVGVDSFKPAIKESRKKGIHNEYCNINVLDIGKKFKKRSFECVLASDLIEHLTKKDGFKLINLMERIASKRVIIFMPNGFLPQGVHENNPYQVHRSGWTAEEMRKRGYNVVGINGYKRLRGSCASLKYKPMLLWLLISDMTQLFIRNKPKYAFQILCVKRLKD